MLSVSFPSSFTGIWGFPHRLHSTKVLFVSQNALLLEAWLKGSAFFHSSSFTPPHVLSFLPSFPSSPASSFSLLVPNSPNPLPPPPSSSPVRLQYNKTAQLCLEIKPSKRDKGPQKLLCISPQTPFPFLPFRF